MSSTTSIDGVDLSTLGSTKILYRVALAFLPITVVAVALRVYVRAAILRAFGWDDAILLASLVFFVVLCSFAIKLVGIENDPSTMEKIVGGGQGALEVVNTAYTDGLCFVMFYALSVTFLKLSLATFFLRIVVRRWQRAVIYTATSAFTACGLAYAFTYFFQCGADITNEVSEEMAGKCMSLHLLTIFSYVYGSFDAATDAIFASLPIALLWNSNMPRAMKLTSGLLLAMGSVSCICAIVRVASIPALNYGDTFVKEAINSGLLSIIEPGLGLVATSLAACRPLWKRVMEGSVVPSLLRWTGRKTGIGSSRSCRGARNSHQGALSYVERSEGWKGFRKFDSAGCGHTITTVMADDSRCGFPMELQDLGSLEAQDGQTQDDNSLTSLARRSRSTSDEDPRAENPVTVTYDISVDVRNISC